MSDLNELEKRIILRALDVYCANVQVVDKKHEITEVKEKLRDSKVITLDFDVLELKKELHPTEQKYPEQTKRFRELLEEEYKTHLKKNADYSAMNILGTGLIGITVRFWDKTARIMNLIGFDIQTGNFTGAKANLVQDESLIDSFMDAGVYAKIAKIYSEGKWGK